MVEDQGLESLRRWMQYTSSFFWWYIFCPCWLYLHAAVEKRDEAPSHSSSKPVFLGCAEECMYVGMKSCSYLLITMQHGARGRRQEHASDSVFFRREDHLSAWRQRLGYVFTFGYYLFTFGSYYIIHLWILPLQALHVSDCIMCGRWRVIDTQQLSLVHCILCSRGVKLPVADDIK